MAYKDEYEVARLYVEPMFAQLLGREFKAHRRASIWLAPPILAKTDPATGHPLKRKFGPWIWSVLPLLARGKVLRWTVLDPFGHTEERRSERALVETYFADIMRLSDELTDANYTQAVELANWPAEARGFGHVKAAGLARAKTCRGELWARFEAASTTTTLVAE